MVVILLLFILPISVSTQPLTLKELTPQGWRVISFEQQEDKQYQYCIWELEESKTLWLPVKTNKAYKKYKTTIKKLAALDELDQVRLLKKQQTLQRKLVPETSSHIVNSQLVLKKYTNYIKPINQLEWTLFNIHDQLYDLINQPSEFGAYFFRKKMPNGKKFLRVYYISSPNLFVPFCDTKIMNRLVEKEAWVLFAHIHNHPFMLLEKHKKYRGDIVGTVGPSVGDLLAYQSLLKHYKTLKTILITNGIDTFRLPVKHLKDFLID